MLYPSHLGRRSELLYILADTGCLRHRFLQNLVYYSRMKAFCQALWAKKCEGRGLCGRPLPHAQRFTRKAHEKVLNSNARKGQGGLRPFSFPPCRVQGQCPCRSPEAAPLVAPREKSRKMYTSRTRERVKGGTPLQGAGAAPLPSQGQSPCRVQRDEVPCGGAGAAPLPSPSPLIPDVRGHPACSPDR